jgi:hypothetical protein
MMELMSWRVCDNVNADAKKDVHVRWLVFSHGFFVFKKMSVVYVFHRKVYVLNTCLAHHGECKKDGGFEGGAALLPSSPPPYMMHSFSNDGITDEGSFSSMNSVELARSVENA